jgi:tetratricopeptide (TPR) repeat protein
MARRAFVPPPALAPESTARAGTLPPAAPPQAGTDPGRPSSVAPPSLPTQRASVLPPPPAGGSGATDSRRSGPPAAITGGEGISLAACAQLLDRLAAGDEGPFIANWIEGVLSSRGRAEPALVVRLLRAYREAGRIDRARELALSLPSNPVSWNPLDGARLAIERAVLATIDGRCDQAEAEIRLASRALSAAPKGVGQREQLDTHLAQAQLDLKLNRVSNAAGALRLAEHVSKRLEDGAWRAPVSMTLGHLSMRMADPRTAAEHYASSLARSPARGTTSMSAHGNLAIALGSTGSFEEGRHHALQAIAIAQDLAAGWRHADAHDVLAIVEIAADRPLAALHAIDEAFVVLGDIDNPMLRYQLAEHRTWALAMLGQSQTARQWLAKAEALRARLAVVDAIDEQDLVATRARTLEACGQLRTALESALAHAGELPDAFVTGSLNLVIGRCALALDDAVTARMALERAALSGERHGWIFPDRLASLNLWQSGLRSGDSRVVRYAERIMALVQEAADAAPSAGLAPPSIRPASRSTGPAAVDDREAIGEPPDGETLIYVTTPDGVTRVPLAAVPRAIHGATLVVDTLEHHLRLHEREVSLERRRALEPLLVQLLRRAREGLSADEILRAAGGPGPESADAEHRVRVLISRVRDLLGDPAAIERVRDAGEHGRTRYRIAMKVRFALIEPLFRSNA